MNVEEIQKFLDSKTSSGNEYVRITFKKRDAIDGLFIRSHKDYTELKAKNFWRIVPRSRLTAYQQTKDIGLSRIFSGSDFSRLKINAENFDQN